MYENNNVINDGKSFIKVLNAHELGWRSGEPGKAGSFALVPKAGVNEFFGELSKTTLNDKKPLKVWFVNNKEEVEFTYAFHNSKYASDEPNETRDEYRLYATDFLTRFKPEDIIIFTKSIIGNYDYDLIHVPKEEANYQSVYDLYAKHKKGRSSSAVVNIAVEQRQSEHEQVSLFDFEPDSEEEASYRKDLVSSLNELAQLYGITRLALLKVLGWKEDFDQVNASEESIEYLEFLIREPEEFEILLQKHIHLLTPQTRKNVSKNVENAKTISKKNSVGTAFIKVVNQHEIGYRSGQPSKAGSYLLIPKVAAKGFFGELSKSTLNDSQGYMLETPFNENPVEAKFIYHNSKHASTDQNETRDEYRLYSSVMDQLKPNQIVLITPSSKVGVDYKLYVYNTGDEGYNSLFEQIEQHRIPRSQTAIINFIDLIKSKILLADMFDTKVDMEQAKAEAKTDYPLDVQGFFEGFSKGKKNIIVNDLVNEDIQTDDIEKTIQQINKIRRDNRFRKIVLELYRYKCSITGKSIAFGPLNNLEAAHIIPKEDGGTDNPINGLALIPDLHWAFDKGFFTIQKDYTIKVHDLVKHIEDLASIDGKKLILPEDSVFYPSQRALSYHRETIFGKFLSVMY
ncbi:HNH endonuclease [Lysinibacillus fusiformis]|uniref:HNH endonuclease n=1 Tax=Lysinibacillus fusiformis TaxID=28031 RepID=UPI003AAC08BC